MGASESRAIIAHVVRPGVTLSSCVCLAWVSLSPSVSLSLALSLSVCLSLSCSAVVRAVMLVAWPRSQAAREAGCATHGRALQDRGGHPNVPCVPFCVPVCSCSAYWQEKTILEECEAKAAAGEALLPGQNLQAMNSKHAEFRDS